MRDSPLLKIIVYHLTIKILAKVFIRHSRGLYRESMVSCENRNPIPYSSLPSQGRRLDTCLPQAGPGVYPVLRYGASMTTIAILSILLQEAQLTF